MQHLLYDPKPEVRKGIMDIYNERDSYMEYLIIFLKNEVDRLLSPLLKFSTSKTV